MTFVISDAEGDDALRLFFLVTWVEYAHTPILPDPSTPGPCDLLILKSNYGDRNDGCR